MDIRSPAAPNHRIDPEAIQQILSSPQFVRSRRMCRFLTLLAERANRPDGESLKETEIGVLVFDREVGYDPKVDSIVRTEATRLRRKLAEYYAGEGRNSPYRLQVPAGRYELEIVPAEAAADDAQRPITAAAPEGAARPVRARDRRQWVPAIAAGVLILTAALWLVWGHRARTPAVAPLTYFPGIAWQPAFSPDGNRVAYTWDGGSEAHIPGVYVQALNAEQPLRLTRSEEWEYTPAWSPDGTEIAFLRRGNRERIELRRVRLAAPGSDAPIAAIAARAEVNPGLAWSPDGAWLATAEPSGTAGDLQLVLISPRTGEKRVFRESATRLAYVRSSDAAVSEIFVAGFPEGPDRQITFDRARIEGMAWVNDGELVYSSARGGASPTLWRVRPGQGPVRLMKGLEDAAQPAVSRDGSNLVFSHRVENINVWRRALGDTDSGSPGVPWLVSRALTSSPQFSPDGRRVAFRSTRSGHSEIWVADSDGRGARRLTWFDGPLTGAPRWSPDGRWIAFDSRASGSADIWVVASGGGRPQRVTSESSNESLPSWSRDGRSIYYNSDATGLRSIWRRAWTPEGGPGPAQLVREHACAGWESPDGKYLYYVHSPTEPGLFRVPLAGGPEEAVLPDLHAGLWGSWAFGPGGVYFVDYLAWPDANSAWAQFRDEAGTVRRLFRVDHPVAFDGSVAVSPDGRWMAYTQQDRSGSDLVLMKHWR